MTRVISDVALAKGPLPRSAADPPHQKVIDSRELACCRDGRRLVMVELRNAGELDDQALMPHRFCQLIDKLTARDTDFLALAFHRKKAENGDIAANESGL